VDQPSGRLLVKSGCVDSVNEAGGHDIENLVEQTSALLALVLLKYEASGHQWNQREAEQQTLSGSGHTALGREKKAVT